MKEKSSFYALITIVCWALSNVFTGVVMQETSTFELAFWRYLIAAAAVGLVIWMKKIPLPEKKDLLWFFLSGGCGFFLYTIFFNLGCATTTSAVSSTIIAAVPLLTAIFAQILFKEKINGKQWLGIFVAFSGVLVLVIDPGKMKVTAGAAWLLLAAVILSCYNLIQRKLTKKYTALQTSVYSIVCGFILLCLFAPKAIHSVGSLSMRAWGCLLIMGIFSSAIAYVCWAKAFSLAAQTSSVSNFMFLTPFVAALLGYLLLGETLSGQNIAGAVLILVGLFWFRYQSEK